MASIFISYRTEDSNSQVELLDRELVAVFGRAEVFRDKMRVTQRRLRPFTLETNH